MLARRPVQMPVEEIEGTCPVDLVPADKPVDGAPIGEVQLGNIMVPDFGELQSDPGIGTINAAISA